MRSKQAPMRQIGLSELRNGTPGISPACGAFMAEAAAVCLEAQQHVSGVSMVVTGDKAVSVSVHWAPVQSPDQVRRSWADAQVATENGAYGVASLLLTGLTDWTVVERSRKGTGFDYWLGRKGQETPLFQEKARFEVSGIERGTAKEVAARVRKKCRQTTRSDSLKLSAIVAVVEFGRPASEMVTR